MKKKLMIALLALAILFTFMPAAAYADTPEPAGTPNTWDSTHTYYYGGDGNPMRGWFYDEDACYYGDPATGAVQTGWKKIGGYWYYFAPEEQDFGWGIYAKGRMYDDGAMEVNGKYYFFAPSDNAKKWGKMQYGWCAYGGEWYYADAAKDGALAAGWKKIDGKWYYLDGDWACVMIGGRTYEVNGILYAFDLSGALHEKKGWIDLYEENKGQKVSHWVYTDANGVASTGWKKIDGVWYHFDDGGYMESNCWAEDSVGTLYLGPNGKPFISRWLLYTYNHSWHYFDANGYHVTDQWRKIDGEWYCFDSDGKMMWDCWARDSVGWCYLDGKGLMMKDRWLYENKLHKWYYIKPNGYRAENEFARDSRGLLYLDENGLTVEFKWIECGGYRYYVGAYGYVQRNQWALDNGVRRWMDSDGRIATDKMVHWEEADYYVDKNGDLVTNQLVRIEGINYYADEKGVLTRVN